MSQTAQPFDYYVVLDFEATCDDRNPPEPQEVIEYPSVLLCGRTFNVIDEFSSFVRPIHHRILTPFCMELTGITQEDVDRAPPFLDVYRQHLDWLRSHDLQVSNDEDGSRFSFIIGGDWDFRSMLPVQFKAADPPVDFVPHAFRRWINIKPIFAVIKGKSKAPGMAGMLRDLGLELIGRHHRGIDDCRNIARIVQALVERGATLDTTTVLSESRYPALKLVLRRGDETREIELHRRSMKSLLGVASSAYRYTINTAFDPSGKQLTEDAELLELRSGTELTVD